LRARMPEPMSVLAPLGFHAFAMLTGVVSGIFARQPILAVIGLGTLTAGILIHLAPYLLETRHSGDDLP
jgi:hypothetical protein